MRNIVLAASIFASSVPALGQTVAPVSQAEREALVALYHATGGPQWKSSKGWLGPVDTECIWEGIFCSQSNGRYTVWRLSLGGQGLTGTLPEQLSALESLWEFDLSLNKLTGSLPTGISRRWQAGPLQLLGYASQFSAQVDQIVLRVSEHSGYPCGSFELTIEVAAGAGGGTPVSSRHEQCRDQRGDLVPFCEVKSGYTSQLDIDRAVWFMETSGFFGLGQRYDRLVTHKSTIEIAVRRMGTIHRVSNSGDFGPHHLWIAERLLFQIRANTVWQAVSEEADCRFSSSDGQP